jgi:hypothetical protein
MIEDDEAYCNIEGLKGKGGEGEFFFKAGALDYRGVPALTVNVVSLLSCDSVS